MNYIIFGKGVKNICTQISIFPLIFFNMDSSFNIENRPFKFSVAFLGIIMEGTVSQIIYLGPSFCFL